MEQGSLCIVDITGYKIGGIQRTWRNICWIRRTVLGWLGRLCLPKRVLLFNEAMPILDAAKDVNNAGTSGALDMRTIPSKRPEYFSATPRSCELREQKKKKRIEMNGLKICYHKGIHTCHNHDQHRWLYQTDDHPSWSLVLARALRRFRYQQTSERLWYHLALMKGQHLCIREKRWMRVYPLLWWNKVNRPRAS